MDRYFNAFLTQVEINFPAAVGHRYQVFEKVQIEHDDTAQDGDDAPERRPRTEDRVHVREIERT